MIFPTVQFAAFFVVVLCASWALMPRPSLWKPFILVASYVFYGYADWRFVALLAASTVLNQTAARAIARSRDRRVRKAWLIAAVTVNLGLLGVVQVLRVLRATRSTACSPASASAPAPAAARRRCRSGSPSSPSRRISYVVDVHCRRSSSPRGRCDFAIYVAFFPHLVAGPIVRAREFIPQLASPRDRRGDPAAPRCS